MRTVRRWGVHGTRLHVRGVGQGVTTVVSTVDNPSHDVQSDQPAIVIDQIQELLGMTPR